MPVLAPCAAMRGAALESARRSGIELRSYFSVPLHRMPAFAAIPVAGALRCTDDIAQRALSLPMSNDLGERAVDAIVDCLAAVAA